MSISDKLDIYYHDFKKNGHSHFGKVDDVLVGLFEGLFGKWTMDTRSHFPGP